MRRLDIPVWYKAEWSKKLTPFNESIHSRESDFEWESTDSSPSFLLKKLFLSGWYLLEVNIASDVEYMDAAVLSDFGKGFSEKKRQCLLLRNGKTRKRVVYLSKSTKRIRFDPAEEKIKFTVNTLRFVKITQGLAIRMMKNKLSAFHSDVPKESILLWKYYSNFFNRYYKSETSYTAWIANREPKLFFKKSRKKNTGEKSITVVLIIDVSLGRDGLEQTLLSLNEQIDKRWSVFILIPDDLPAVKYNFDGVDCGAIKSKLQIMSAVDFKDTYPAEKENTYFLMARTGILLSPHALFHFSSIINGPDGLKLVYADHDVLDDNGERVDPIFKCDWNPDLFLSQNYLGPLVLLHSSLLGGINTVNFDLYGAWVFELILQSMHELSRINVRHLALILMHQVKTERDERSRQLLSELELKAISNNCPAGAAVRHGKTRGTYRISYPLPTTNPLVTLIIPTRDQYKILKRAIDSILGLTTYTNFEIIVIDNQSVDKDAREYLVSLTKLPNVRVIKYDADFNYSAMNNLGVEFAKGEIIGLINNDIEVIAPEWLTEMVSHAVRNEIGCVGSMLYYPNDSIQHAGVVIGLGGCAGHSHKFLPRGSSGYEDRLHCIQNYSAVTAACLLVRKSIYKEVGGLDALNLKVAFNDVDFCLRIQEIGYRNLWTPWAELYHHESLSRGADDTPAKKKRSKKEINYLKQRWKIGKEVDPYYSEFLTVIREDFTLGL